MSQILSRLPLGFEPYYKLNFCSNILIATKAPISIKEGLAPLLIGRGPSPRVWMSAGMVMNEQQAFFQIVKDNVPNSPQVRVVASAGTTTVLYDETVMCRVEQISSEEAAVTQLDLRPAGLNVTGDRTGLKIGANRSSGNHVEGAEAFLTIG
ncbi:hypothetical protein PQR66_03005 [Paraburkholderia agricolaris]|uniref:Uncharacterized protein n=1 Tax=Paraburkholderia agricolaris TaxID=2152888 RepID=A0ABW8ZGK3_9BURK|nr:hypothetical protein [Paraburkholderia agricolaris]